MLCRITVAWCNMVAARSAASLCTAAAAAALEQLQPQHKGLRRGPPAHLLTAQRHCVTTTVVAGDAASSNIYDQPQLYDEVFRQRDYVAEAKFLMGAFQRHTQPGGSLRTVLELGCGPANHATQLALRGVQVWALDTSPAMLQYAADKAASAGATSLTTVSGDMRTFEVQGMQGRFDMVVCLLSTFAHMTDNKAAAAAFSQAAAHLRPGGVLVLDLAHPGDLFDRLLRPQDVGAGLWEVERLGGRVLTIIWGTEDDGFDPLTQVVYCTLRIYEAATGGDGGGVCLVEQVMPYRLFTAQEVDLLGMMSGLEVVGVYGDLDLGVWPQHEDAFKLATVLRKGEQPAAAGRQGVCYEWGIEKQ